MNWIWNLWRVAIYWGLALVLGWCALFGGTVLGFLGRAAEAMLLLGGIALAVVALVNRCWHLAAKPASIEPKPPAAGGAKSPAVAGAKSPAVAGAKSPAIAGAKSPAVTGAKPQAATAAKTPALAGTGQKGV
ncbi:MAG: hypothetical protein AB1439_10570 [candidate division FCPU426 bacterium]